MCLCSCLCMKELPSYKVSLSNESVLESQTLARALIMLCTTGHGLVLKLIAGAAVSHAGTMLDIMRTPATLLHVKACTHACLCSHNGASSKHFTPASPHACATCYLDTNVGITEFIFAA